MRIFFTILLLGVLGGAQVTDNRVWEVRFGIDGDTTLWVSSNAGTLEFRNEKALAFTIPAGSITSIFYARQQVRRSTQAYNFFEGICCGGTDSHLLSALAFLVAAPLGSSKSEYVEIDWTSKGAGSVQLKLPADQYTPFMEWVSRVSGVRWRDLERERQEAVQQILQRESEAFFVSERGSDAIEYKVLALERDGNTLLYFFRDSVAPKNLVWILPVTEEPADNTCVHEPLGKILRGACRGRSCEVRAILRSKWTYRPGTLPRSYTVDADGLSPSECPAIRALEERGESVSSRETIHGSVPNPR